MTRGQRVQEPNGGGEAERGQEGTGGGGDRPALTRHLPREFADLALPRPGGARPGLGLLTEREREILVAVREGWNNTEVASPFVLSESTAKTHVGRIFATIGAGDRTGAVIFAYGHGPARPHAG